MKYFKSILIILLIVLCILNGPFPAQASGQPQDGTYKVGLTLSGGTGRVSAVSPADLTVSNGNMNLRVTLSSSNYTYMIVNGTKYLNEAAAGEQSTFQIPITCLDSGIKVTACTEAMSTPHEIDYTITVSSQGVVFKSDDIPIPENDGAGNNTVNGDSSSKDTNESTDKNLKDPIEDPVGDHSLLNEACILCGEINSGEITEEKASDGTTVFNIDCGSSTEITFQRGSLNKMLGSSIRISTLNGILSFDEKFLSSVSDHLDEILVLSFQDVSGDPLYTEMNFDKIVDIKLFDEEGKELFAENEEWEATIVLPYGSMVLSDYQVMAFSLKDSQKEAIEADYDSNQETVTLHVSHFSKYGIRQEKSIIQAELPEDEDQGVNSYGKFIFMAIVAVTFGSFLVIRGRKKARNQS